MRVIGIDPGATGALALIDTQGDIAEVWDLAAAVSASTKTVSGDWLSGLLSSLGPVDAVFVEEVHANTLSYKGNFTLGMATGVILGVLAAMERPVRRIKPKEWQKTMGLTGIAPDQRKEAHRFKAIEMFPSCRDDLRFKLHHNRADALLIAEAGRQTL